MEEESKTQCLIAIDLAHDAGCSEIVAGLMQILKDDKNHKDALELMLLAIESE